MRNIRKRKSEAGLGRPDSTKLRDLAQHKSGFAQTVEDDLAIAVLFNARWRDAGWIMLACLISFNGARAGAYLLGPELGVCIGAILMGAGSNLYSRWLQRPSAITTVPGLMMIVPGSIGFGSLAKFIEKDVVSGLTTAFSVVLIAVALATGLLMANVIVPPRKTL